GMSIGGVGAPKRVITCSTHCAVAWDTQPRCWPQPVQTSSPACGPRAAPMTQTLRQHGRSRSTGRSSRTLRPISGDAGVCFGAGCNCVSNRLVIILLLNAWERRRRLLVCRVGAVTAFLDIDGFEDTLVEMMQDVTDALAAVVDRSHDGDAAAHGRDPSAPRAARSATISSRSSRNSSATR